MSSEGEYQKGAVVVYEEDHARLVVEVVENSSDKDNFNYKMRVKSVLQHHPNPRVQPLKPGDEFNCHKMREGAFYLGNWYLTSYVEQGLEAAVA